MIEVELWNGEKVPFGELFSELAGKLQRELGQARSSHALAVNVYRDISAEFTYREIPFTGQLLGDVEVGIDYIRFRAPHAWKWAEGYFATAKKGKYGWYIEHERMTPEKRELLERWIQVKAPHLADKDMFRIRIPYNAGFMGDAYREAVECRFNETLKKWVDRILKIAFA